MALKFEFRKEYSSIFGAVHRPMAQVSLGSLIGNRWIDVWMIVDSGADYTLLPRYLAADLGVNLEEDCKVYRTSGIGGAERVYLVPKLRARLGDWERDIPVGFLERNEVPPLMGRQLFMETFETHFSRNHTVSFSE